MNKKKLVMIGNGMAGMKAIEEILAIDPEMFDITIFGGEKYPNYNRILLSSVLAGDLKVDDVILNDEQWYKDNNITLHLGRLVETIDRGRKKVIADKVEVDYDYLIIATGSNPFIIPIPGADKKGVVTFRDIDDCHKMIEASNIAKKAAVIGGGLLGLEAAKGLINRGMDVTVIHDQPTLMNMQLDTVAGEMLRTSLESQGMKFLTSTLTKEIKGNGKVEGLSFANDTELETELVVMSVGIRPNKTLAEKGFIYCNRGIMVNDYMQTITDPSVYSLGECVEHRGQTYGLVAPLFEQARILAYHITGNGLKTYQGSRVSTKLKISGVDVFSAGDFETTETSDVIEYLDKTGGVYKKIIVEDEKIKGVVMFGDTVDGPRFFQMLQESTVITEQRSSLLFGNPTMGDTGHGGAAAIEALPDDAIICGCNGVKKKTISDAIIKNGITTVAEVKTCTKASASCGGCAPLVEQLMASLLGNTYTESATGAPICSCTELTHEEVKKEIKNMNLTTVKETMNVLDWGGEGCQVCRPAINYYLQMISPEDVEDDRFSRIANERMHANIQKDGTFSVIPRIYGGVTTPDELLKIAEVSKKYNVPTVKFTGGQRIDLLGVKKEDLIPMWKDLDMPSGFAYGKALRTVKTCVGNTWCRFGTQDSMKMGIILEKVLERIWTPAKVKLAVSGCPRNCAEASIKDLGITGIDGAWELYAGGNGGVKVRTADLLCTVKTEEEVLDIAKAYIQFYREDGRHNERTSAWIDRIGLEKVKEEVINDMDNRNGYIERMDLYLSTLTTDPWEDRIKEETDSGNNLSKSIGDYKIVQVQN